MSNKDKELRQNVEDEFKREPFSSQDVISHFNAKGSVNIT